MAQWCKLPALVFGWFCLSVNPASALIMTGTGNQPVSDAGWPQGALAVANLRSRAGWWEGPPFGGGEWHFIYQGGTAALGEAIEAFAAIRAPALEVVLHDGPGLDTFIKGAVDWTFTVWVPASWHFLYNNPRLVPVSADTPHFHQPVDPPRLEVYLGQADGADWSKVKLPARVRLRDERASASAVHPLGGSLLRADVYDMATGKTLEGRVIDDEGKPLKGVEVHTTTLLGLDGHGYRSPIEPWVETNAAGALVLRPVVETDDAGRFTMTDLPKGFALLSAQAPGHYFTDHFTVFDVPGTNVVLHLSSGGTIQVRVTDHDGHPAVRVEGNELLVTLEPKGGPVLGSWDGGATVKADGTCEFKTVPAGEYRLTCRPNPSHSGSVNVRDQFLSVVAGQPVSVHFVYE